jgi:hypothetical protein
MKRAAANGDSRAASSFRKIVKAWDVLLAGHDVGPALL